MQKDMQLFASKAEKLKDKFEGIKSKFAKGKVPTADKIEDIKKDSKLRKPTTGGSLKVDPVGTGRI